MEITRAIELHRKYKGKLSTGLKVPLDSMEDMKVFYTPGVADPCKLIAEDPKELYECTIKHNTVAVVTDGSAVLGLGNIGAAAGLPVMEGKCALFKKFADVDAFPICLDTQNVDEIVQAVKWIAPVFGGINLEDIAAPRCFEIERRLQMELDIPVFHDDQHGTAIVVLAGLINSLKVVKKKIEDVRIVISGAGAAGIAICDLLLAAGAADVILVDSRGAIVEGRSDMNDEKNAFAKRTNPRRVTGSLAEAMRGADVVIGVSKAGVITSEMVGGMSAAAPIVFAMSNPTPEIMPDEARAGGAAIVATGRSDYPNQLNNVLVFPGVFRGALDHRVKVVTIAMQIAAAKNLAALVTEPTFEKIIPGVFEPGVAKAVAEAVR
jgi:malate dehydrogenase (oxaloacetate-decarboxylating)